MKITIPQCVLEEIPKKTPFDNQYFYHAEDAWKHLGDIRSGKTDYINDHYAMLVNTLERFYKGMILSCHEDPGRQKMFSEAAMDHLLTSGHRLASLVDAIENSFGYQMFNCKTRSDFRDRDSFLKNLTCAYTSARYSEDFSYKDFCETYDFVKSQKERIYEHLSPTTEKVYHQDGEGLDDL